MKRNRHGEMNQRVVFSTTSVSSFRATPIVIEAKNKAHYLTKISTWLTQYTRLYDIHQPSCCNTMEGNDGEEVQQVKNTI